MSSNTAFTKENLDLYLKELAKEFRKLNGKIMPAEITLIGGASVLANYGFREQTYDMDAIIEASSAMKEAINHVGDKFDLPNGWLNTDFVHTKSYTPKLLEHSVYYRTYSNVLTIRTISSEYLVAMKLMSGRAYKNDLSDVVGILMEQQNAGSPLTYDQIGKAVTELYGGWDAVPSGSKEFIQQAFGKQDYAEFYKIVRNNEKNNREALVAFDEKYPGVLNEQNINDIISAAKGQPEGPEEEEDGPIQQM